MRAGRLRHRVELQRLTETQNDFGEPDRQWQTFATVSASFEPLRGRERMDALQVQAEVDHRIEIRWSPDVQGLSERDRVLFKGNAYDIKAVMNIEERDRRIEIMARKHL